MTYKEMLERLDSTIDRMANAGTGIDSRKLRKRCQRLLEFEAYNAPKDVLEFQMSIIEKALSDKTPEMNALLRGQLVYWGVKIQLDDLLKKQILETV